ncbi:MAG: hypothetical protein AAFR59_17235, partial [Bacteroidota bacterium]
KRFSFFLSIWLTLVLGMISSPTKCQSLLPDYMRVAGGIGRVSNLTPHWYSASFGKVRPSRVVHLQLRYMGGIRYRQGASAVWIREALSRPSYEAYVLNDSTYFPFLMRSQTRFHALYFESDIHLFKEAFDEARSRFSPFLRLGLGLHHAQVRVNALDQNSQPYTFTDSALVIPLDAQTPRQSVPIRTNVDWDNSFESLGDDYSDSGEGIFKTQAQLVTGLGILYKINHNWSVDLNASVYWSLSIIEWTDGFLFVQDQVSPLYSALQIGIRYDFKGWPAPSSNQSK